ncbi:MAG TPA: SPFH domain-containing protein [Gemmatimonadaceae bacterium]|nr:SPFH domain-containing protein [Gemmatimonadaceae bacterium]
MSATLPTWIGAAIVAVGILGLAVRIVRQYEGGVVLRFGRLLNVRTPGLNFIIPVVDRMYRIDMRVVTLTVEPQEVITRDNVTIKVDAVVYFAVVDCAKALLQVVDFGKATSQIALTTLRSVLGQSELDELLAHREKINRTLQQIIDQHTEPWGVVVSVVEVKDVLLPEAMQRSMAAQAEAEREKRAKVIRADGEYMAAETLGKAARIIRNEPPALQLRYLQTLVEIAGERNSTIIPIPLDIMEGLRGVLAGAGRSGESPALPVGRA